MYQRLYVPVDDSETANLSLTEAARFTQACGAQLRVVHVSDFAQFGWGGAEYLDPAELKESVQEAGIAILDNAKIRLAELGASAEMVLLESWGESIADKLVADADQWRADLIMMGTHGWGELKHLLLGSVVEGVLKHSSIPVILLRIQSKK